jgi:hypothetical protein
MVHLTVHLPDEAILRGPVQYGWMYPVERRLFTLKHSVRNMARPEGSIAEAYVANECLTACSRYFDDLDTRHNWEGRITYQENIYDKMVWYVLNNCLEVEQYIEYVFVSTISLHLSTNLLI